MPGSPIQQPLSDSPLYIRWGPDKCPYAIELKLELITFLRQAVIDAAAAGLEVGGVLVGSLPTLRVQTLRIEDVELIGRRADEGATFMLDGGSERFADVRHRARMRERSAVGLFRSHLRSGSLRPSIADRTLLAGEFKEPVYALFLAQGLDPFKAAFFVASNGPLPAEMSVREFKLDGADFESLPEVEPERQRIPKRSGVGTVAAILLIVFLIAGVLFYLNEAVLIAFLPSSTPLGLKVESEDGLLRIAWNHAARDLDQSRGGLLTVRMANGSAERRIRLGLDELRLGVVACESDSTKAEVKLTLLNASDSVRTSTIWSR